MSRINQQIDQRRRRHQRVRAKVKGTAERPRLAVFRSSRHIYAQLINDDVGRTVAAASDQELKGGKPLELAAKVGAVLAERAGKLKIKQVAFDRAGYLYAGRVKSLADGARGGGLNF
ncbi:MAG: 50S ribosomal protein L18 [Patescibacteria group bacterium]